MNRALAFGKLVLLLVLDWFLLGLVGQQAALLFFQVVPDSEVWGWGLYALGLLVALVVPLLAHLRVRSGGPVSWVCRATLVTFPVFFCGQLIVAGTPDWNPVPLLIGWAVCIAAGLAAWALTRSAAQTSGAAVRS